MSDKYFNEAQRKVLIVDDGDVVSKHIIEVARIIYDEAQALKPADPRLSDDPLTALKAFCEHHLIELEHEGLSILSNAVQFFYSECGPTSADDIKPEK